MKSSMKYFLQGAFSVNFINKRRKSPLKLKILDVQVYKRHTNINCPLWEHNKTGTNLPLSCKHQQSSPPDTATNSGPIFITKGTVARCLAGMKLRLASLGYVSIPCARWGAKPQFHSWNGPWLLVPRGGREGAIIRLVGCLIICVSYSFVWVKFGTTSIGNSRNNILAASLLILRI